MCATSKICANGIFGDIKTTIQYQKSPKPWHIILQSKFFLGSMCHTTMCSEYSLYEAQ